MLKPILLLGPAVVALAVLAPAQAVDPGRAMSLAEKRGCIECHEVGAPNAGPSYSAIAARYRHDTGARDRLVDKIRFGGAKHWGERFNMWPHYTVTSEEAQIMVEWILQQ
jgi:cytochrome c